MRSVHGITSHQDPVARHRGKPGVAMGSFIYDRGAAIQIDDRTLAHLQAVVLDKLRRNESFALDLYDAKHWSSVWISRRTALEFRYTGNRPPSLNRDWLEALAGEVGLYGVLRLTPEPIAADQPSTRVPVPA